MMKAAVLTTGAMRRSLRALSLVLLIAAMVPASLPAQSIRIGSLGLSGPLLPLWIAQDRGLFAKHGLSSELITFQGGRLLGFA